MAAKMKTQDTFVVEATTPEPAVTRVRITIPKREEDDNPGVKVDQYEHVSISNEHGDFNVRIKRGIPVDVTIPVFTLLKQKYPDL